MFFALNMTCEVYWDLDFEPLKKSGGQPVALGGVRRLAWSFFFVQYHGGYCDWSVVSGVVFEAIFGTLKSGPWRRGPIAHRSLTSVASLFLSLFNVWRIVAVRHSDRGF